MSYALFDTVNQNLPLSQEQLRQLKAMLTKIIDKGGLVAVVCNDSVITSYNYTSFERKLAKKSSRSFNRNLR